MEMYNKKLRTFIPNNQMILSGMIWTVATWNLMNAMVKLGYTNEYATYIINECKSIEGPAIDKRGKEGYLDARRCVIRATAIGVAESSAGKRMYGNSMFSVKAGPYNTVEHAFDEWLWRYKKWWFKHRTPWEFQYLSRYSTSKKNRMVNTQIVIDILSPLPLQ